MLLQSHLKSNFLADWSDENMKPDMTPHVRCKCITKEQKNTKRYNKDLILSR